jgi:xylose isomerase
MAISEIDRANVGVTLDFAHMLYSDEQPAFAAALAQRFCRIFGLHLNDGYAKRDDGLMVGAVHPLPTIELLRQLKAGGYVGPVYFDTFPDASGLDPVRECEANIATVRRMFAVADALDANPHLAEAMERQDAIATLSIVNACLYGRP